MDANNKEKHFSTTKDNEFKYQKPKVLSSFPKKDLQKEIEGKSVNAGITPQLI